MFKLNPFHKHPPATPSNPAPIESTQGKASHSPFTEEQIRKRAHQVWKRRIAQGKSGTPKEDWQKAIEELQLSPFDRWWAWTGIPDKKGWDLVQLLTSISIPVVLFAGGSLFTYWNNQQQQQIAEDRRKQDIQLADDKAKQDTLVKYLDDMSKSIEGGLLDAAPGSKAFVVAQSRTVLALQSLDKKRQGLVVQFLKASGLNEASDDKDTKKFINEIGEYSRGGRSEAPKRPKNVRLGLLYEAQMAKANLPNSDLSGATLIRADLRFANLGCDPPDSKEREHCSDLSWANLRGAIISQTNLSGASLWGADLVGVLLWRSDLKGAILNGAILEGARFYSVDLRGADLSLANLQRAGLRLTNFTGATLYDATFRGAYLDGVNLSQTDLTAATLYGATLGDVDLMGAILLHTDLANAENLTPQQLTGKDAPLLCNVRLPKNIKGIDPNRDCDRISYEVVERYPKEYPDLKSAQKYVNNLRQQKFE